MPIKKRHTSLFYQFYELVSSMRFAISLLTILAIASVVGTVLKQNEPYPNYAFEFGQFWFVLFGKLGLYDVYHSGWFLTILAFLVLSTSLCVVRNAPGFVREMRAFREKASDTSLALMAHSTVIDGCADPQAVQARLQAQGFRVKQHLRDDGTRVLAAKKGAANKLGYFFAHIAMVVICIGGLIDGNLPLKLGELVGRVVPETRDIPQSQIPAQSRLSSTNLSYRGNVTIGEQRSADVVFLNAGNGYLVQELPFIITLKKFHVDYYSNGMPKLFASDIVVTDKATGKETEATVKVNHPLIINGVAIYQASFGDGGSPLKLTAWNLQQPDGKPVALDGVSMGTQPLTVGARAYQLEFGELKVFNIENMGKAVVDDKSLGQRMQDARSVRHEKQLLNLGPAITFKLRDDQGQAREYHHYMAPIAQDGRQYQITGVRAQVSEPFQYMRIPLDGSMSVKTFMRLNAALADPTLYDEIARRAADQALQSGAVSPALRGQFEASVKWVLAQFAQGGFPALERFIDDKVPQDKRQAVAQTYVKILQGTIGEVMAAANRKAGVATPAFSEDYYRFLLDALVASSSLHELGSPVYLELSGFDQVQASGLQLTRSPGKNLVYLGSLLLIIGIILMFYVREVRLWVVFHSGSMRLAMTSNRHNRDLERDFAQQCADLNKQAGA